ncbi:glutamine synthetase [Candidatus Peregrinibacteria bacterium CG10_big_fil_rev_8_21_14_0_10_36_19]|nr:MAG: glutamine synthetase [Candidatus Peregrinibacteria bacterium CG10_big_fil_rev_8_21_14_0_10_36_19]
MSDLVTSSIGVQAGREIKGREREYGAVLWKQPHLLDLSYAELEEKNLEVKMRRLAGVPADEMRAEFLDYLSREAGIKCVTVCFSDLEGRLHTLDYDRKFIIGAEDNLTFDGSSIKGFTDLAQSDLRLKVDWGTFRWLPADLFGAGKVLVFGNVCNRDGSLYESDFRALLHSFSAELSAQGLLVNVAPEVEGFLFDGLKAEQIFDEEKGFELATMSGYFSSLPQDTLRLFIDKFAEVKRALAFENEKDHPEVAPAQFELNFKYCMALETADQIQLYKFLARQVANSMGYTASFLPKPIQTLNGSGMHMNMSISNDGKNSFYDADDSLSLSAVARRFVTGILYYANDLCLIMNSSVNSYRRLDPNYEAPNAIKFSAVDRGSMIRIPVGNEKSARIEVRTVAPDANPYMCIFSLVKAGLAGIKASDDRIMEMEKEVYGSEVDILPSNIYEALGCFGRSDFMREILGEDNHLKYMELKEWAADRSPKALGTKVKKREVLDHHEVTNQFIKGGF